MIATFDWFGYELLADERYRLIKQTGFDGVLLWWDDEFGDGSFRTNPEQARRAGLTVLNAHAPFDRINEIWFKAEKEGLYYGQCSELCGQNHAFMPIAIRVVSESQYDSWLAAAKTDVGAANKALMAEIDQTTNDKVASAGN